MAWQTVTVPSLGGGINVSANPLYIDQSQWSWGDGFIARNGVAETLPAWNKINTGGWLPALSTPVCLCQNPFDTTSPAILIGVDSGSGAITMVKMTAAGVATAITWDAVGTAPIGSSLSIGMAAFLNNSLVIALGAGNGAGVYSIIRYGGGATYHAINTPATGLSADYLVSFKSTLVAGSVSRGVALTQATQRQFAWADINTTDTWDPSIANAADFGFLDDLASGMTGMGFISQDTLGLFTANAIHALVPGGGIPLFTRQALSGIAIPPAALSAAGLTILPAFFGSMPNGSMVKGADNLYLLQGGAGSPVGNNIIRYLMSDEQVNGVLNWCGPYLFHKRLGMMLVTRGGAAAKSQNRFFYYDPLTSAWSHRATISTELSGGAAVTPLRQAYIVDTTTISTGIGLHWLVDPTGNVYRESPTSAPAGGEYFDTKDFTIGDPAASFHVNLVRVEWEPLTTAGTDAITVFVAARDSFAPLLGSKGMDMQGFTFTSLGTLTGGVSDLPCNVTGKVMRFRFFNQSSTLLRIRGFSFRCSWAGDRPMAVAG